jgi:tRNA threonylcarbamoyladenosine biosynthesis protein TsaB
VNLLGVDCSSENLSLSIVYKGKPAININRRIKFGASELIVYIERYLKKIGAKVRDFDTFVIGSGPGSFTGLRISFSVIKAFALVTGVPVVSMSSFFSCALQLKNKAQKITILSDARKNLLYRADFNVKDGLLKMVGKIKLISFEDIKTSDKALFATYDSHLRKEITGRFKNINFYPEDIYPMAELLTDFISGSNGKKVFTHLEKLEPLYIHPKTCQIRKRKQ